MKNLPDGELNPGLPRDRRGYLPLYYRGLYILDSKLYGNYRKHLLHGMKNEKRKGIVFMMIPNSQS